MAHVSANIVLMEDNLWKLVSAIKAFPDAMVEGFEELIPAMTNHEKDRHVLAAAVKCGAHAIVSDNQKDFPPESMAPYNLECLTADAVASDFEACPFSLTTH